MGKFLDLTGKSFGNLTVISFHSFGDKGRALWNCKCSCGEMCIKRSYIIQHGISTHCGCIKRQAHNKSHNEAFKRTKEYRTWSGLRNRCNNIKCKKFHRYGGRGIKVCERWEKSYENFLTDMGRAPSPKHSIDRINVDGNYEPSNCKWSTAKEQCNNTSKNRIIVYSGDRKTLAEWCRDLNLSYSKTHYRIHKTNCSTDEAFGYC